MSFGARIRAVECVFSMGLRVRRTENALRNSAIWQTRGQAQTPVAAK